MHPDAMKWFIFLSSIELAQLSSFLLFLWLILSFWLHRAENLPSRGAEGIDFPLFLLFLQIGEVKEKDEDKFLSL